MRKLQKSCKKRCKINLQKKIAKKGAKTTLSHGHLKNMLLEDIFEGGDKIGWIWPFLNIVYTGSQPSLVFGQQICSETIKIRPSP